MSGRRIVFVSEAYPFPSGGVAVIYKHAEILTNHGFNAVVALPSKPPVDFYNTRARLMVHGGTLDPRPGDIWVIPEGFKAYVEVLRHAPVKRLMFCQNQYYLPFTDSPHSGFAEFGVDGVIASSESVRSFFHDVYGLQDVPLIPCSIDPQVFALGTLKRQQIAFMPRKLADEAAFIQATFRRLNSRYADVPWIAIAGMTQQQAAEVMSSSGVFLSLSSKESFGLPPLEAMSSGCFVVGFHGDGGREYMTAQNGWWAESGDWRTCVDGLAAALDLLQAGGIAADILRKAMATTVERYSPKRMELELLKFWRTELAKPIA